MVFINTFIKGYLIIGVAIILNIIAKYFNLTTWFDVINNIVTVGLSSALIGIELKSLIFLFIIYTYALGFIILTIPDITKWIPFIGQDEK